MSIKNTPITVRIVFTVYQMVRSMREIVLLTVFGYVSHCQQNPTCGTFFINTCSEQGVLQGMIKSIPRALLCSSSKAATTPTR